MKKYDYVVMFEDGYEEVCFLYAHDDEEAKQFVCDEYEILKDDEGVVGTRLIDITTYYDD